MGFLSMPESTVPNFFSVEVRNSSSVVGCGMGIGKRSTEGMVIVEWCSSALVVHTGDTRTTTCLVQNRS